MKASAEPLKAKGTQLEDDSALLRRSVRKTLINYRAKLRDSAKLKYPDSDFDFMNAIYPDEDDNEE